MLLRVYEEATSGVTNNVPVREANTSSHEPNCEHAKRMLPRNILSAVAAAAASLKAIDEVVVKTASIKANTNISTDEPPPMSRSRHFR